MAVTVLTPAEAEFIEQRDEFLEVARARYPSAPSTIADLLATPPQPCQPIVVESLDALSMQDAEAVAMALTTGYGVAHLVPTAFTRTPPGSPHHMLSLAHRLADVLPIGYPVDHPMESHPEAAARFGPTDGTLKIYNLPVPAGGPRYREQAETNEMFDAHNDGLGYAGLIATVMFTLDSPPLAGGFTFFQNLVRASLALAESDQAAFDSLFLPDAIVAIRPRGKGAIKVTSPVLFVGRGGYPQTFFRVSTGEYRIEWRNFEPLNRARAVLERLAQPFGPHSRFVHLMRPGETIILDNMHVIHGRTPFVDPHDTIGRVLARKWFVRDQSDTAYKHVPSVHVHERWARLFPEQFASEQLSGEWHYDASLDLNVPVT